MHGKTGAVITLTVLLDIVGHIDILNILAASIEQVGIHVDTPRAIGHTGRDTTQGAVITGIVTKVPRAVLGIAGQVHTAAVHRLGVSLVIAAHSAGSAEDTVDAPCLRQGCCSLVAHHVKHLVGTQRGLVQFDGGIGHYLGQRGGYLDSGVLGKVARRGGHGKLTVRAVACEHLVGVNLTAVAQGHHNRLGSLNLHAELVAHGHLVMHLTSGVVHIVGEAVQGTAGIAAHGGSVIGIETVGGPRDIQGILTVDEAILHRRGHVGGLEGRMAVIEEPRLGTCTALQVIDLLIRHADRTQGHAQVEGHILVILDEG